MNNLPARATVTLKRKGHVKAKGDSSVVRKSLQRMGPALPSKHAVGLAMRTHKGQG